MKDLKFKAIGTNSQYFYPENKQFKHSIFRTDLEVWSGFKTSVDIYEGNKVKLLIDFTSRILRNDNILDYIHT